MHLKKLALRNFRRLRDVVIDLASDISIFVGANNSGKTSVGHALQLFTEQGGFSVHHFSADQWPHPRWGRIQSALTFRLVIFAASRCNGGLAVCAKRQAPTGASLV
jgi:predicted ATP-dependent endonuclease of OLD family